MPLLHYLERDVIMYNICIGGRVFAEKRERGVDIKVSERSIILAGRQAGRQSGRQGKLCFFSDPRDNN